MDEKRARALLREARSASGMEAWIAEQRWRATATGWDVTPDLQRWHFRLDRAGDRLRIRAFPPGGADPEIWEIPR
jgi:hypothetical protein